MRIKKKDVLLESLLIDVSTEFNEVEKRILKSLNKKYGNPYVGESKFNQWEVAAWLIENLDLPYDIAYELTKTYYWNYNKLFSDVEKIRKTIPISELFFDNLSKLMQYTKDEIGENYGTVTINFKGDSNEDVREVLFWDRFNGFGLYIPTSTWSDPVSGRYYTVEERNGRLIMIDATFKPIDLNGGGDGNWRSSKSYEENTNNDIFSVSIEYTIGDRENKIKNKLMDLTIPYPKPLSKNTFVSSVKDILDKILEKLSSTKFDLPSGV